MHLGAYMTTGDRIRKIREHKNMTQDQLADKAGISKAYLSDVENNNKNISSKLLLQVANALGASVDYLLSGESKESRRKEIVIPPALSETAEKLNLSYNETLDLLNAYNSVVARRSIKSQKEFLPSDWEKLHNAIKGVFG
jgi:transcriptional regulator with XRE-family HTH domain